MYGLDDCLWLVLLPLLALKLQPARDSLRFLHTEWEVFIKLHPPNEDGSYTYGKPKKIAEEVQAKAAVLSQPPDGSTQPQPVDMGKLFVDTAGLQKGRIPGIGNISKAYTKSNGCRNSTATFAISDDEISRRINERVEELVEQRVGAIRAEMQQFMDMMRRATTSPSVGSATNTEENDLVDADLDED